MTKTIPPVLPFNWVTTRNHHWLARLPVWMVLHSRSVTGTIEMKTDSADTAWGMTYHKNLPPLYHGLLSLHIPSDFHQTPPFMKAPCAWPDFRLWTHSSTVRVPSEHMGALPPLVTLHFYSPCHYCSVRPPQPYSLKKTAQQETTSSHSCLQAVGRAEKTR